MADKFSDAELDALLDIKPAPRPPAEGQQFSDDELDSFLGVTKQEPYKAPPTLMRDLGLEPRVGPKALPPERPLGMRGGPGGILDEPVRRAAVGAGGALGELVGGSLQMLQRAALAPFGPAAVAGTKPLMTFDRREFVRRFERAGLLGEANLIDRASQFVGEGAVDMGAMVAGGAALKAAGLAPFLANTAALSGTMSLAMQQQATAQGRAVPAPREMSIGLATMAGSYLVGLGASKAIIGAVSKLRGPLSKTAQDIIGNATTGLMFEAPGATGIIPGVPRDPEWKARLLAAIPPMMIVNVHQAAFDGEAKPRTKDDMTRSMDAVAELANETKPLEKYPIFTQTGVQGAKLQGEGAIDIRRPIDKEGQMAAQYTSGMQLGGDLPSPAALKAAERVAIEQAEITIRNEQAPLSGANPKFYTPEEILRTFNIPEREANRIAKIRISKSERAARVEDRRVEQVLQRVPADIESEVRYRAKLMDDAEREVYESVRRDPPLNRVLEIEQWVDRIGKPGQPVLPPVPLYSPGKPGPAATEAVSPNLGEAPPSTGAVPLAANVGPGPVATKAESPALGEAPARTGGVPLAADVGPGPVATRAESPALGEAPPRVVGTPLYSPGEPGPVATRAESPALGEAPARTGEVPLVSPGAGVVEGGEAARAGMTAKEAMAALENSFPRPAPTEAPVAGETTQAPTKARPATKVPATEPARAAARTAETAAHATNAEVAATTQTPAEATAKTNGTVEQAKATLAEETPTPEPGSTKKTKKAPKSTVEGGAILDAAAQAATRRAERAAASKPKMSPEEAQQSFWNRPEGKVAIAGVAAGTALATAAMSDDDDVVAQVALAASLPIMAALRKGKRTPNTRWTDDIRIQDAKVRDEVRAKVQEQANRMLETTIYTGKLGPRASERVLTDLAKSMIEAVPTAAKPRTGAEARALKVFSFDPFVQSALGKLGRVGGPAGKAAEKALRAMQDEIAEASGGFDWIHRHMPLGPFKKIKNPSAALSDEKAEWLADFMNWQHAPQHLERPDMSKLTQEGWQDVQRAAAIQMDVYRGAKTKDAEVNRMAEEVNAAYDDMYAGQAAKAFNSLSPFHLRMTVNGKYRPQMLDPRLFDPPGWMDGIPGLKYDQKLEQARKLQEAAAASAEGGPIDLVEFQEWLRHLQNRGYTEGRMLDEPMANLAAGENTHLDFHRAADLRVGIIWDPMKQANSYMASTERRLAFAAHFGPRAEVALALRDLAVKDGYSGKLFTELFDLGSGMSPRITNPGTLGRGIRSAATLTALPKTALTALIQPSQFFTAALQVGVKRTVTNWPNMIRGSIEQSSYAPQSWKNRVANKRIGQFLANAGAAVNHTLLQEAQGAHGPVNKLATAYYRVNLTTTLDRMARNLGKVSGAAMFDDLMDELKIARQRGNKKGIASIEKQMREIFRENDIYAREAMKPVLEPGQYEFLQRRAAIIIDRKINFRTLPGDMPTLYSNPVGRTLYSIGTFTYQAQRQAFQLIREFAQGSNTQRMRMFYALGFATVGSGAVYAFRDFIFNRGKLTPEEDEMVVKFFGEYVAQAALQGFIGPGFIDAFNDLSGKYGNPAVSLAGPFWSEVVGAGEAYGYSIKQDSKDPLLRYVIRTSVPRPAGKKIAEKVVPKKKRGKQLVQ